MSVHVRYGDFQFQPWEAGIAVHAEHVRSKKNMKHYQAVRYNIVGEICEDGATDVNTRLSQIITAFSADGQNCGLYFADGSPTVSVLNSNIPENITGNLVYYKRMPETRDGEFVSGREFEIGVGAYLLDPESEILEHSDSLQRISNAGPEYRWRFNRWWGHYPELVATSTKQVIIHSGYRIGATRWPAPTLPLYPPPFELNHLRQVEQDSPMQFRRGRTGFRTSWRYIYHLPTFDDVSQPSFL